MSDTRNAYLDLVNKRRTCRLCRELTNPAMIEAGRFDAQDHVGSWSRWQGNLSPNLVIVGQEWADQTTFCKCRGRDNSTNKTNATLLILLRSVGISIDPDRDGGQAPVFLTNAVLCLKDGGMQARVKQQWFTDCSLFLSSTASAWERTPWRAVQRAAWDALARIR